MRGGRARLTAAAATAGRLALAAPPAAAATGRPAPKWHIAAPVTAGAGAFTAVAATGWATGWAFGGQFASGAAPTAWQLTGGRWARAAFPGQRAQTIVAAGASSPSDVWAFTQAGTGSRVLHDNGSRWARAAAGSFGYGTTGSGAQQVSFDGGNGLWLPRPGVDGQKSYMVPYAAGRLTPYRGPRATPASSASSARFLLLSRPNRVFSVPRVALGRLSAA